MATAGKADLSRRMHGAVEALKQEFGGLRTGRAHVGLVEPVTVEAYGAPMPLTQVGTVAVPEPRMLSIQVWDKALVGAVEKGIRNAGLGLNPVVDGQTVRVPVPELTEERRKDLSKVASQYAEQAKVAVRNVRRHGMDELKQAEKDGEISQDEHKKQAEEIQKLTDDTIAEVDQLLEQKQKEIMQV